MKILISSHTFAPSIGGIQTFSQMLAEEFVNHGHEVKLVTQTQLKNDKTSRSYPVIRCPSPLKLLGLVRWSEIFFHSNISLRTAWPLLFLHRPWVVTHHIWIPRPSLFANWVAGVKRHVLCYADKTVSVSQAIAEDFDTSSIIITNPYDDRVFRVHPDVVRDKELIFVGRLISAKGVHILLEALSRLAKKSIFPRLTIVGSGPEAEPLKRQAEVLGISSQLDFAGTVQGEALSVLMNSHHILVVPSVWEEPFGIVALEGLACGCVVIGSRKGGLKDAIGPCGVTFSNGDVSELTQQLEWLCTTPDRLAEYREKAREHLKQHTLRAVAARYLELFEKLTK
jgi:glycosyltransferase involved in cell wall biosynthesis